MKKTILYLTGVLLLIACGGDGESTSTSGTEYLNVRNLEIKGEQTRAELEINASPNCEWTITWSDSWILSITPTTGRGKVTAIITTDVNSSSISSRSADITIANENNSIIRNITITQSASNEYLELSNDSLIFSYEGGTLKVAVRSNTHWKIEGGADWINQISPTEGNNDNTVTFNVGENYSSDEHKATLSFVGDKGISKSLVIKQIAAPLPIVTIPKIYNVTKTSAKFDFTFDSWCPVTSYGVCYSTIENPSISSPHVLILGSSNQGSPSIEITGLEPGETYHLRAYALSAVGPQYSEDVTFTTLSSWPNIEDNTTPNY